MELTWSAYPRVYMLMHGERNACTTGTQSSLTLSPLSGAGFLLLLLLVFLSLLVRVHIVHRHFNAKIDNFFIEYFTILND